MNTLGLLSVIANIAPSKFYGLPSLNPFATNKGVKKTKNSGEKRKLRRSNKMKRKQGK